MSTCCCRERDFNHPCVLRQLRAVRRFGVRRQNGYAQQQFVKLGQTRGDQIAVLSGVNGGDEVVSSGVFKLRSGMPVQVNNSIQPANSANPNPPNQ